MADIRVYQQSIDVIGAVDVPDLRVYHQSIDVIGLIPVPDLRVYQQYIDVIGLPDPPALQVSQQNIQVAGGKTSEARVSRLYLEILTAFMAYDLEQDLGLTDEVSFRMDTDRAEDTLTFLQVCSVASFLGKTGTSSLTLTDEASYTIIPYMRPESTLSLTDEVMYIGPHWVDVESTLELTSIARVALTYTESVGNSLVFTQDATFGGSLHYNLSNDLNLSDFADTPEKIRGYIDTLTLTDSAEASLIKVIEQTLTLTDYATTSIGDYYLENTLELTQDASVRDAVYPRTLEDTLTLTQDIVLYPHYGREEHDLELTDVTTYWIPYNLTASSNLVTTTYEIIDGIYTPIYGGLSDSASVESTTVKPLQHYIQWYQDLFFEQKAQLSTQEAANNTLVLSQSATVVTSYRGSNTLVLTDSATLNRVLSKSLQSNLNLAASFGYTITGTNTCTFDPTVGASTDPENPRPMGLTTGFTATRQDTISFWYPYDSPTNTVEIRNPELGNTAKLEFQRINRKTRGGTLIVWADNQWPKIERTELTIRGLTETQAQEYQDFVSTSLGKEIGFTDWENNSWIAIIMNPDAPLIRNRVNDVEITVELELTWSPIVTSDIQTLSFTDSSSVQKTKVLTTSDIVPIEDSSSNILIQA